MKTVVLYHKSCTDGYISALNFYAYYKENEQLQDVVFMPVQYGEGLPDEELLEGNTVYVLDFSFGKEDTVKLLDIAGSVCMLDHHKKAVDTLFTGERFIEGSVIEHDDYAGVYLLHTKKASLMVDNKESGATLAYNEVGKLIKNDTARKRLEYLSIHTKDRDLWVFSLKDTLSVYEYINSFNHNLETGYVELICSEEITFHDNLSKCQVRVDMRDELASKYAKKHNMIDFMGYKIPMVNVSSDFSSIVGDVLGRDNPFALMYSVGFDKIYISLRSNVQTGVDVNKIASLFGGGGHVNAAGFTLPVEELSNLLKGKILTKNDVERKVDKIDHKKKQAELRLSIVKYVVLIIFLASLLWPIINYSNHESTDIEIPKIPSIK